MNMYVETIPFVSDMPVAFSANMVSHYHLHCHEGILEVLIILRGSAQVKVSFEEFDMKEGDFVLVNNGDSHSIYATDSKCQVASLYINMEYYKEQIPYLEYVLFACESFDLVKYKNETQSLRRMISNAFLNLARLRISGSTQSARDNLKKSVEELLWIFVNDYDMKNYYNRNWNAGYNKTEKYYKIMQHIYENYDKKNLMDHISKNEFYSKSYITHLFKQVGASSFQDVLTYVRLYKSERLLLDSELPINEISDRCGFSDIKYYTSNFKKWFLHTPSEYRKIFQPEVQKNSLFQSLRDEEFIERMENLIRSNTDNTDYKAAINPLSVKTKDSWKEIFENADMNHLFYSISQRNALGASSSESLPKEVGDLHQVCIKIDEKSNLEEIVSRFASLESDGYIPSFIINYSDMDPNQCNQLLMGCAMIFSGKAQACTPIEITLAYSNPTDKANISNLLLRFDRLKQIQFKAMLMA